MTDKENQFEILTDDFDRTQDLEGDDKNQTQQRLNPTSDDFPDYSQTDDLDEEGQKSCTTKVYESRDGLAESMESEVLGPSQVVNGQHKASTADSSMARDTLGQFMRVEEELEDSEEEPEGKEQKNDNDPINYRQAITNGSFMPVILLLHKKHIDINELVDESQGLRILHYACYFGKIKALKTLVEVFSADINALDYRGQTPLHVASTSGELGCLAYLCSLGDPCDKEVKDNAMMTPLMNSVAFNQMEQFVYLYFKEGCELKSVDINGNVLLHFAAKSNSINVAKLLRHLFLEIQAGRGGDPNLSVEEKKSPERRSESQKGSLPDKLCFFDLNRANSAGQTPIFLTVQNNSVELLKFMLKMKVEKENEAFEFDLGKRDLRGDTVKESIIRHTWKDKNMMNAYLKYEQKLIIQKLMESEQSWKEVLFSLGTVFKCERIFIKEFLNYFFFEKFYRKYQLYVLVGFYLVLFFFQWIFLAHFSNQEEAEGQPKHSGPSFSIVLFNLSLIFIGLSLFFLAKSEPGFLPKKSLFLDKDSNIIGKILELIEERMLHRIEENRRKYCFDCLLVLPKHSVHCNKCRHCVLYKHKHSRLFARCIGQGNALPYLAFLLFNFILFVDFLHIASECFGREMVATRWVTRKVEGALLLWRYSKPMFLFSAALGFLIIQLADDLLTMLYAVSRKLTVLELQNIWNFKYCFKVVIYEEGKNRFEHRSVSLFQMMKNLVQFCRGKSLWRDMSVSSNRMNSEGGASEGRDSPRYQEFVPPASCRSSQA